MLWLDSIAKESIISLPTMPPQRAMTLGPDTPNPIEKRLNAYENGDVNLPEQLDLWRANWRKSAAAAKPGPYLTRIKQLAGGWPHLTGRWPHLQVLADFMDVGTAPARWNDKVSGGYHPESREKDQIRRMQKTRVCLIDYPKDSEKPVIHEPCKSPQDLKEKLDQVKDDDGTVKFRLWVVEDLSREVIEMLGYRYDIDPSFFREHILDYVWYNIRDWWRDPPNLDIVTRSQNWFQMRFPRLRYFKNKDSFAKGTKQTENFNVERRLEADHNQSKFWDTAKIGDDKPEEARVGTTRTRVTFWMQEPRKKTQQDSTANKAPNSSRSGTTTPTSTVSDEAMLKRPVVGVLLLDPTIEEGHPLWRNLQYRNWTKVPPMSEDVPNFTGPSFEKSSFFDDFIHWASTPEAFQFWNCAGPDNDEHDSDPSSPPSPICLPTQALLHMVCNEWLTLLEYIKTRLMQIDWAIAFPSNFLTKDEQIEEALQKLHHWRRVVPIYRTMLTDTFLRVFREMKHPDRMHPDRVRPGLDDGFDKSMLHSTGTDNDGLLGGSIGSRLSKTISRGGQPGHATIQSVTALDDLMNRDCVNAYKQDYSLVLTQMEECQARIDRLTEVLTAVISMEDSRRGYKDNKNLQWLTWLATFFIPLSFVATMLSMTTGPLSELRGATILWAEVSIPSGLVIMLFVLAMSIARSRRWVRKTMGKIPGVGKWQLFRKEKGS